MAAGTDQRLPGSMLPASASCSPIPRYTDKDAENGYSPEVHAHPPKSTLNRRFSHTRPGILPGFPGMPWKGFPLPIRARPVPKTLKTAQNVEFQVFHSDRLADDCRYFPINPTEMLPGAPPAPSARAHRRERGLMLIIPPKQNQKRRRKLIRFRCDPGVNVRYRHPANLRNLYFIRFRIHGRCCPIQRREFPRCGFAC